MIPIDSGKPLARGRTADIYPWDDGFVRKFFHNWFDIEDIRFEQKMARLVHVAGTPVPAVGDILKVNEPERMTMFNDLLTWLSPRAE